MHTRSPFLTPLFFNTLANWHTLKYSSLYVSMRWCSSGSLGSQIMAGVLPRVARWQSRQFSVIFSRAPSNHFTEGSLKFHSSTLSHFFFHEKCSATDDQKPAGSSTLLR